MKTLFKIHFAYFILLIFGITYAKASEKLPLDSAELMKKPLIMSIEEAVLKPNDVFRLCLGGQGLETLPESISNLIYVHEINASQNKVKAIPDSICGLIYLIELNLSANYLYNIPECLPKLVNLQNLDLSLNPDLNFDKLIPILSKLKKLITLNLSFNEIKSINENISQLSFLREIDLSGNELSEENIQFIKILLPNTKIFF